MSPKQVTNEFSLWMYMQAENSMATLLARDAAGSIITWIHCV